MHSIVLLYNDRDRPTVESIGCQLEELWKNLGVRVWVVSKHLTAFGDIFQQIEEAIEAASGVVVFLGLSNVGTHETDLAD